MVEKQLVGVAAFAATRPDLFVEGYFSTRVMDGDKPSHGYPSNHLPEINPTYVMKMVTGLSD